MKSILSTLNRRWMFGLLAVLLALYIAFNPLGSEVAGAQSCNIRTDWPVYVVLGGDTLNKITQRYGTTADVLASTNCLPNTNVMYRGQQLHVPPSPVVVTPLPVPSITVVYNIVIGFQPFDNGFMLWRADTGEISVYLGQVNGKAISYPSYLYGLLPDNPVKSDTPAGHSRPAFGIGKVWGNFFEVRNKLGWALAPEQGFLTAVVSSSNSTQSQTCFNLPNGGPVTYVRLNTGESYWMYPGRCG